MRHLIAKIGRRLWPPQETLAYQHDEVASVVLRKTVAFSPVREWTEAEDGSCVLDFGGGCGLHYKQAHLPNARWAVVETPTMAEQATQLSTERLRFFTSIRAAADWLGHIDLVHSDGALHYAQDPSAVLAELCALKADRMVWHRTRLSDFEARHGVQYSFLEDHGPGWMPDIARKRIACPFIEIPEHEFLDAHGDYCLVGRGVDWFRFALRKS